MAIMSNIENSCMNKCKGNFSCNPRKLESAHYFTIKRRNGLVQDPNPSSISIWDFSQPLIKPVKIVTSIDNKTIETIPILPNRQSNLPTQTVV